MNSPSLDFWTWTPLAGLLTGLAFTAWIFSRMGTLGTYRFTFARAVFLVFFLQIVWPVLVAVIARGLETTGQTRIDMHLAAGIGGLISMILAGFLFMYIAIAGQTTITFQPGTGPVLLEPACGIAPRHRADPATPLLRVALSGDPHVDADTANHAATQAILARIGAGDYDAFFPIGDIVEIGLKSSAWQLARDWLHSGLGSLPVRPLMGNHDAILNACDHYRAAFFPAGMRSDSGSPYYYSIAAGPVLFIVINLLWGTEDFDQKQRTWFENSLATVPPGVQIVVLSHCFLYSSGHFNWPTGQAWYDKADTIRDIAPLLERYKVTLSVSGHNHYMEYLRHSGVGYAVIGAMGGKPDPIPSYISPASIWQRTGNFGYLDLAAWPDRLELQFIDQTGQVLHRETLSNPRQVTS